jgi:glycosyltransferase involved in cell wall biosynthesis
VDRPRLKVLYISRGYTLHDRRFLTSFAGRGWKTTHLPLIAERLEDRLPPSSTFERDPLLRSEEPATPSDWAMHEDALRAILTQVAPDVVTAGPVQSAGYLTALAGASPLVNVSWGTDILVDADRTPKLNAATEYSLAKSSVVFGDCRALREALKRHSHLSDDEIVTFPWGIDFESFTPGMSSLDLRDKLGWQSCDVFISTCTWEQVYAIDVLVDAFAKVQARRPGARLILLGDGSRAIAIRDHITRLGLDSFAHARGPVSHALLPDVFREADVYVSSALSDDTSVSLLETMATGLPVVASDSYGNLEWIEPGVNGALASPRSPEALAAAMLEVVADPEAAGAISEANVTLARDRADWSRNLPLLARKVESIVAR